MPTAHDAYLESRIASAGPVELVRLLYQGASSEVRRARSHLAAGEIVARSRAISKAFGILTELTASLDRAAGGEIAGRLAQLYDYMQRRLTEANFAQADAPLVEVLGLLATLGEAWEGVEAQTRRPEPELASWSQAAAAEAGAGTEHVWTL